MSTDDVALAIPGGRLRRIEAVTDAALAHLSVEELLVELLDRVRELLMVDTAAVLLLDASSQYLVATAARGIEEEVRQGIRIPLGKGFAGRIAAQKQPVYIEHVDHGNVLNPILREKGIHSLLGVPLMIGGEVLGVLHVGTLTLRHFTVEDTELLQLVGDRVALATQARLTRVARTAAATLQRSLLPSALPDVPGLEIAARYVPGGGGEVGGDWYDVFDLPSGRLCIVVGDVVGRGLPAAVAMSRLRSALRAYALQVQDPADLLHAMDVQVQHFEPDVMATVLCAIVEPTYDRLLVSSAGHPPPVAAAPGRMGEVLELPADLPLGVDPVRPRHTSVVPLHPGHGLLFYTDGLIERRGVSLDVGLEQLSAAVRPGPPDAVCTTVMSELLRGEQAADDVAILMLWRLPTGSAEPLDLRLRAEPSALRRIRTAVRRWAASTAATAEEINDLLVAVGEASANVVEHAYGPRGGMISVQLSYEAPAIVAVVGDNGRWRPARGHNRGRGTALIHGLTDGVEIEHGEDGTRVTIRKNVAKESG
jgi:anti-sigma regulatory factor (Ser/Thr protein kinase)/putative methionine-R-sulfoxide reductase with GAF domain